MATYQNVDKSGKGAQSSTAALLSVVITLGLCSCSSSNFAGSSGSVPGKGTTTSPRATDPTKKDPAERKKPQSDAATGGQPLPAGCTKPYQVPASANIWLAGVQDGTSLTYQIPDAQGRVYTTVDRAPAQNPVLVAEASQGCIVPGFGLTFSVTGQISHGGSAISDANGLSAEVTRHRNGGVLGKSDLQAPINGLIAVFLGDGDVSAQAVPAALDHASEAARNQVEIAPALGQVYFVGTGKVATGESRTVVVPAGATRLYFGIMDAYEWNNNTGGLTGAVVSAAIVDGP